MCYNLIIFKRLELFKKENLSLVIKTKKTNLYEFFDENDNLIGYIFFFIKKVSKLSNTSYILYCLYLLDNTFNLKNLNYLCYQCIYLYLDTSTNSFLFNHLIYTNIFNELLHVFKTNHPHLVDVFLYDSLIEAYNYIKLNDSFFYSIFYNKEYNICFSSNIDPMDLNKDISNQDMFLFFQNEQNIYIFFYGI